MCFHYQADNIIINLSSGNRSEAAKRDMSKFQLVQNKAAHIALRLTRRANVNWLKVEERLTPSLW